ncbi:zinc-dependent peptidase [Leptolyngbya sp. 15MV]|nr:zinc-dependent peptidase [Leptolyngbya sp. 15MV]
MRASLSAAEWSVLDRRWSILPRLPRDVREAVGGISRVLLHEKTFEGCGGLEVTDEHRLLIAAQAALLLAGRDHDWYSGLKSILVYPSPFVGRARSAGPGGVVTESRGPRSGESWHNPGTGPGWGGPVVLSWPDVARGASSGHGGRNVTLHEFAHQLDAESEMMEGIPRLATREDVDRAGAGRWPRNSGSSRCGSEPDPRRRSTGTARRTLRSSSRARRRVIS